MQLSPFSLDNESGYWRWRDQKLRAYPRCVEDIVVPVVDMSTLSDAEQVAIVARCRQSNMAIYRAETPADKDALRRFGQQLGLLRLDQNLCADEDGISALQVVGQGQSSEYIPYTDQKISWHTDGYYNAPAQTIRAMILHCVSPAARGGDNAVLDHEMMYLLLRDENPDYIKVLMEDDVMTVPPNRAGGQEIRAEQTGPVFSIDPATGNLHMRYTARTRSIAWKQTSQLAQALGCMEAILQSNDARIFHHRMDAGEGIVCNNVLHNRTAFEDDRVMGRQRLVLRARYHDRIAGTDVRL